MYKILTKYKQNVIDFSDLHSIVQEVDACDMKLQGILQFVYTNGKDEIDLNLCLEQLNNYAIPQTIKQQWVQWTNKHVVPRKTIPNGLYYKNWDSTKLLFISNGPIIYYITRSKTGKMVIDETINEIDPLITNDDIQLSEVNKYIENIIINNSSTFIQCDTLEDLEEYKKTLIGN
jgi:hypothetical protein